MRPISSKWLKDSITLLQEMHDPFGNGALTELATLTRVRVEHAEKIVKDKNGNETTANLRLFVDVVHTLPTNYALGLKLGDIMQYLGNIYTVVQVKPFHDMDGLHHIEVLLNG